MLFTWLLTAFVSAQSPLPGIDSIASGYHIFLGNPNSWETADPGLLANPIFQLEYRTNQTTHDGRWLLPDNVAEKDTSDCTIQGAASIIDSVYSYHEELSASASLYVAAPLAGAFTASSVFRTVSDSLLNQSMVSTSTTGVCSVYKANVNYYTAPNFTADFKAGLASLPNKYDRANASAFWTFFQVFGTHAFLSIELGARWGQFSTSTSAQWSTIQSKVTDVQAAATWAAEVKAGVAITDDEKYDAGNFTSNSVWKEFSLGPPPPQNASDINTWINTVQTSKIIEPIRYQLIPISNFLASTAWASLGPVMDSALADYCGAVFQPKNLTNCQDPPVPPPTPAPTPVAPTCVFDKTAGDGTLLCEAGTSGVKLYSTIPAGSQFVFSVAIPANTRSANTLLCEVGLANNFDSSHGASLSYNTQDVPFQASFKQEIAFRADGQGKVTLFIPNTNIEESFTIYSATLSCFFQ